MARRRSATEDYFNASAVTRRAVHRMLEVHTVRRLPETPAQARRLLVLEEPAKLERLREAGRAHGARLRIERPVLLRIREAPGLRRGRIAVSHDRPSLQGWWW